MANGWPKNNEDWLVGTHPWLIFKHTRTQSSLSNFNVRDNKKTITKITDSHCCTPDSLCASSEITHLSVCIAYSLAYLTLNLTAHNCKRREIRIWGAMVRVISYMWCIWIICCGDLIKNLHLYYYINHPMLILIIIFYCRWGWQLRHVYMLFVYARLTGN